MKRTNRFNAESCVHDAVITSYSIHYTKLYDIGAVSLSQKKAEEMLDELKQRFNVTEEEGKAFLDRLENTAKET